MGRWRAGAGGALACLLTVACAAPSEPTAAGALPDPGAIRPGRLALGCASSPAAFPSTLIHHRDLQREDFQGRADTALASLGEAGERGAQVGLTILCSAGVVVEPLPDARFTARLDRLRYFALLDRGQSWWNREAVHISPEWTLRHEQLHFDLAEIEARKLNVGADAVMAGIRGRGPTRGAAMADLQRRWRRHMLEVRERLTRVEQRYDLETRHGLDLARQTEWFLRGKRGLQASQGPAGPGPRRAP